MEIILKPLGFSANANSYELKGDKFGVTSLGEFKYKYRRQAGFAPDEVAPFCSDRRPRAAKVLGAEDGWAASNLVNCMTQFPFEHNEPSPTIANFKTNHMLYEFVDSILAGIVISIDQSYYSKVVDTFISKYGELKEVVNKPIQNRMGAIFENTEYTWSDGSNTIRAIERAGKVDNSLIMFSNVALMAEKSKRTKMIKPANPDL